MRYKRLINVYFQCVRYNGSLKVTMVPYTRISGKSILRINKSKSYTCGERVDNLLTFIIKFF